MSDAFDPTSEVTVPPVADLDATIAMAGRIPLPSGIEQPGGMIGRYTLLDVLGEGGFGTVWRAEQREPIHREVALKVIKPGMDSREIIARFEAERQALALMDHPNIAAVLDAGTTENGRPFFAMELVKGVPITDYCDAKRLGIRQRLELFIPVCQAVQHAHQKSILHRDLKPSNILVTEVDGKAVPKVIDFGIAKALGETNEAVLHTSLAQTIEGMIVGTPQYMSPEQAGSVPDVDTRSDIYTLGVILYELLTGSTPLTRDEVKKAALDEVLRLVREGEPRRPSSKFTPITEMAQKTASLRQIEPRKLGEALKGDLDWIVMRTLEKDRERRYETANALALELGRHLNNEPVLAGPPSVSYRLGKFVRRQKGPLSAAAALFVVSLAGTAVSWWQAGVAKQQMALAKQESQRARTAETIALRRAELIRSNLYVAEMNLAAEEVGRPRGFSRVAELTDNWRPASGELDLRGWEWYYLKSLLHEDAATLQGHTGGVQAVAYSPDGTLIASASEEKTVRLWDALTRKEVRVLQGHTEHVYALAWSPDGRLASGSRDRTVRIWDPATGANLLTITGNRSQVTTVSWNQSGTKIGAGVDNGSDIAKIWNAQTGVEIQAFQGKAESRGTKKLRLFWRPNHNQVALVQPNVLTRIVDADTGTLVIQCGDPQCDLLQWSPNGALFAMGGAGRIGIWKADDGKLTQTLAGHFGPNIRAMSWSQDGKHLASGDEDGLIRVWEISSGNLLGILRGHFDWIRSISWNPNGLELASGSSDGTVKIWDVHSSFEANEWTRSTRYNHHIMWRPDGGQIAVASSLPTAGVSILDPLTGKRTCEIPVTSQKYAPAVAWSPDGSQIATLDWNNSLLVLNAATGTVIDSRTPGESSIPSSNPPMIAWKPNGNTLAYGGRNKDLIIYESSEAKEIACIPVDVIGALGWSPDGSRLAARDNEGVRLWETKSWKQVALLSREILRFQWSPDGKHLVAAYRNGSSKMVNASNGVEVTDLGVSWETAAWNPAGNRVATSSSGTVRLLDSGTGKQLAVLRGDGKPVFSLAWSPDGMRLLGGGVDRIFLWDASKSYEMERERLKKEANP